MLTVLLVLQIIITLAMIVVILIQRNSGDGMAGLAGSGNSIMSGRASANLLTRVTSILATVFIVNSLVMGAITARSASNQKSIVDEIKVEQKAPSAPLVDAPAANKAVEGKDITKTGSGDSKQGKQNPAAKPGAQDDAGATKPSVPMAE